MKGGKQSVRTTIEDVMIGVHSAVIEFDRVTTWVHDAHYGADADGNRGMAVDMIDEDYAENVTVQFDEDREQMPLASLSEAHRVAVEVAIDAHLETHEPDWQEQDDEPDPDRAYETWRDRQDEDDERGGRR
jgi:hypothetical protein